MIYLVLGMHKSGTTLVTTILHNSGINMGEGFDKGSYDSGNQFERREMFEINLKLLGADDDQTLKLASPSEWFCLNDCKEKIAQLVDDCNEKYDFKDWGMKDPRTCLTYDVWNKSLAEHRVIAIFRQPEQIWSRYRWKGWRRRYVNAYWAWLFLNRWYEYNEAIVELAESKTHDLCVINYQDFMRDDTAFNKLSRFVGFKLVDLRKKSMYRNKKGYDMPLLLARGLLWARGRSIGAMEKKLTYLSSSSAKGQLVDDK